jgi:hypothetical protein
VKDAAAPATTIAITIGDNRTLGRATAMMATTGRSDEAPETTGKGQSWRDETAIAIPVGPTATGTHANAIARSGTRSRATFTCHADAIASWCTIEIASTRCVAPNRERWRPLARSE